MILFRNGVHKYGFFDAALRNQSSFIVLIKLGLGIRAKFTALLQNLFYQNFTFDYFTV
jgi:hypothetical protein